MNITVNKDYLLNTAKEIHRITWMESPLMLEADFSEETLHEKLGWIYFCWNEADSGFERKLRDQNDSS